MAITIENLSLTLSQNPILEDVNLKIEQGEICCILGKNGAGKTTLFKCILGAIQPNSGDVIIDNVPVNESNRIQILQSIGVLFDSSIAYDHLTVWENICIISKLYNIEDKNICEQMLVFLGLENEKKKLVKILSSGMRQRLGLAIANLHHPSLLLLDEPTNALDPQAIIEFRYLMKQLNKKNNTTILYNTHNLDEAQRIGNRIVILKDGTVVFDSKIEKIEDFSVLEYPNEDTEVNFKLKKDSFVKGGYMYTLYHSNDNKQLVADIPSRKATIEDIYLAKHHAIL